VDDDTLTAAITRLRARGYTDDLEATDDGALTCARCGAAEDPATMRIDRTVRFEGSSDPGDEAILLAITCRCGARGLYSAAYGPAAPPADAAALTRFAARGRDGERDGEC
jgi:hypothetical protein